jgi:hypothetical protein
MRYSVVQCTVYSTVRNLAYIFVIIHHVYHLQLNLGALMGSNLGAYVLNLGARLKSTPPVDD